MGMPKIIKTYKANRNNNLGIVGCWVCQVFSGNNCLDQIWLGNFFPVGSKQAEGC